MTDLVDTVIEDDRWMALGIEELAAAASVATLRELGLDPATYEIAILACDDARITTLNSDFRGKPQPTNVLSWPAEDLATGVEGSTPVEPSKPLEGERAELGDIAIAYETCVAEAKAQSKELHAHVSHLLTHGCLHLLGYDHIFEKDAVLMEGLEVKILAKLGIADPY